MTLFLHNTSKNKTLTLRYGNGNNFMIQLNPLEKAVLPLEITKQKLQSYLHLFKDLKIIDDSEPIKMEQLNNAPVLDEENTDDNEEKDFNDSNSSDGKKLDTDSDTDTDETVAYEEKDLNKLSAKEVKEIAAKLGIEVTDESTKKALIPVILNKQGN